jgi:serine/threonine protein kinase
MPTFCPAISEAPRQSTLLPPERCISIHGFAFPPGNRHRPSAFLIGLMRYTSLFKNSREERLVTMKPGQSLLHYRLIEKIGEGGMGVVWKALDIKLDREVAIKLLPEDLASDPERSRRFEREAKAAAALNHANIVTLYSVEDAEGIHFLAMELVEGRTLAHVIPDEGLPVERFSIWLCR